MSSTKLNVSVENKPVRVSAFGSAGLQQDITINIPGAPSFVASGKTGLLKTEVVTPTKPGDWEVIIKGGGHESRLVFARIELANKLNVIVVGSEDSTDMDFNDTVCIIQWPVS